MKRLITIVTLVSFLVSNSVAQKFQKTDFEGYYTFNGNANDLSGNNRNGIVNYASLVKDRSGNPNSAYSFNGSNSYISFNEFNPNSVKTFNFWIKPSNLNNSIIVFFSMREPSTANGFSFYKNNERYLFEASDGVHFAQVNLLSALDVNKYSMITCKFGQDGMLYIYLNGRLDNKSYDKVPEMVKSAPLFIGSNYNKRYFFEGVIEDVSLYNKSLTDKDIDDLYNGNLDDGLIGKYLFKGNANNEIAANFNGYVNNASLVRNRKGFADNAYSFNGESSYIQFSDYGLNSVKTVNLWVKPGSVATSKIIFFNLKKSDNDLGFSLYKSMENLCFEANDGNKQVKVECPFSLETNQYSMVTCKVEMDGSLELFIDGKLKAVSKDKISLTDQNVSLWLGTDNRKETFFNGTIDELSIYNRPLTNYEIESLTTQNFQDGLIGYFSFDGNTNDQTGNKNFGKVHNVTLANDKNGDGNQAYSFNGKDSYIEFSSLNPNIVKTVNFWVKPSSLTNQIVVFFSIKDPESVNGISFYKVNNRFFVDASNNQKVIQVDFPDLLTLNEYSFITFKIGNDGLIYLYQNGKLKATSSEKVPQMIDNAPLLLGVNRDRKTYFFSGIMDELSIFDRPLSDDEINSLYRKEKFAIHGTVKSTPQPLIAVEQKPTQAKPIQIKALPDLIITGERFVDNNGNNIIDAGENNAIKFKVQNIGKGEALKVRVKGTLKNPIAGLNFGSTLDLGTINGEETKEVELPIRADMNVGTGLAEFKIEVIEDRGLDAFPLEMKIETEPYQTPRVLITDAQFSTEDGGKIKLNYPISLRVIVQNIGKGTAKNVNVKFNFINENCLMLSEADAFDFSTLNKGESKQLEFLFTATRRYVLDQIPIKVNVTESEKRFAKDTTLSVKLDQNLVAKNQVVIQGVKTADSDIQIASLSSDVDKNIPESDNQRPNRYALIIGNEDYTKYQRGLNSEMNVEFARSDASVFKDYAIKTMGVPEGNIMFLEDATIGEMSQKIELISKLAAKTGPTSELIFYYAGHGLPDEVTKIPYLIPVDISATNVSSAIKLTDIYKKFAESGASKIIVFLDACFSGGGRESGLVAARGVKVRPKVDALEGNFVVFTASSGEQSALPYKDKQHGIFTYFLLKKLQESKGNITYGDLASYITKTVSIESLKVNQKEQDPSINISIDAKDSWSTWTIK